MTDKTEIKVNISTAENKVTGSVSAKRSMLSADAQTGGAGGRSDKNFVFTQATAASVWKINHSLNKYCSVSVVDSAGNVVVGDISYIDKSNIEISFSSAFAGKAYLN